MKILQLKIVFIILVFTTSIYASSAAQGDLDIQQKDGSAFKGKLMGDEWFSWISLENGYVAKYNNTSRQYEYLVIKKVNNADVLSTSGVAVKKSLHQSNSSGISGASSLSLTIKPIEKKLLLDIYKKEKAKQKEKMLPYKK